MYSFNSLAAPKSLWCVGSSSVNGDRTLGLLLLEQSLSPWTAREVPRWVFTKTSFFLFVYIYITREENWEWPPGTMLHEIFEPLISGSFLGTVILWKSFGWRFLSWSFPGWSVLALPLPAFVDLRRFIAISVHFSVRVNTFFIYSIGLKDSIKHLQRGKKKVNFRGKKEFHHYISFKILVSSLNLAVVKFQRAVHYFWVISKEIPEFRLADQKCSNRVNYKTSLIMEIIIN